MQFEHRSTDRMHLNDRDTKKHGVDFIEAQALWNDSNEISFHELLASLRAC